MAFIRLNMVTDSTSTSGTGAKTLTGVVAGRGRTVASVMANGDTGHFFIYHQSLNEWEIGLYTFSTTGPTLTLSGSPFSSSNSGSAVAFSAGTKFVEMVMPAEAFSVITDGDKGHITVSGNSLTIDNGVVTASHLLANTITAAQQEQVPARSFKGNSGLASANESNVGASVMREVVSGAVLTQTTAQTATASTTNLTAGSYTIAAGTLEVGSEYRWEAIFYAGRGATTTATNLVIEMLINGAVVRTNTLAITITASQNRGGRVVGRITTRTTGAAGTAMASLESYHDLGGTAGALTATIDPARSASSPGTTAIDTTQARSTELRMRLSAATATCYVHMLHCTLTKVR